MDDESEGRVRENAALAFHNLQPIYHITRSGIDTHSMPIFIEDFYNFIILVINYALLCFFYGPCLDH